MDWQGCFVGKHLHRAALALDELSRGASEGLCRRPRGGDRHRPMDEFPQPLAASPDDGQPATDGHTRGRLNEIEAAAGSCGYAVFAQTAQTRCPNTHNGSGKNRGRRVKKFFEEEEKRKSRHATPPTTASVPLIGTTSGQMSWRAPRALDLSNYTNIPK
jgi:hypothetical protein